MIFQYFFLNILILYMYLHKLFYSVISSLVSLLTLKSGSNQIKIYFLKSPFTKMLSNCFWFFFIFFFHYFDVQFYSRTNHRMLGYIQRNVKQSYLLWNEDFADLQKLREMNCITYKIALVRVLQNILQQGIDAEPLT